LLRLSPCHRAYRSPTNVSLRVLPAPLTWRAVSTRLENVFTAVWWPAITSDSNFMQSSFRLQSELGLLLLRFAPDRSIASRCSNHCIACAAQGIKGPCGSGVILSFLPARYIRIIHIHWAGRSRVTNITHDEGCVRFPT